MSQDEILLSVVATSRNDNHGKNLHYRMQQFVNGFVEQCKRHDLRAELILVEWNPPDNTLPLSQALEYPQDKGPCTIRIIRVPKKVHMQLDHADKIPLFQMIGKNVGIRRAKGKFVLATNIDIIFSDALMQHLKNKLKTGHLYRVDRLDVPEKLPDSSSYDDILQFCSKNVFRINQRSGTTFVHKKKRFKISDFLKKLDFFSNIPRNLKNFVLLLYSSSINDLFTIGIPSAYNMLTDFDRLFVFIKPIKKIARRVIIKIYPQNDRFPHTNACGDFTLLSFQDWSALKGYPEWETFSWHLDSVLIYQARQHQIKEIDLPRKLPIYHIEHEAGSGFSPESAHLLFARLHDKGIPYLSNEALKSLVKEMSATREKIVYNNDDWGMSRLSLEEIVV